MKAMILAAGRGERMRPLSDEIPKPLLKVGTDRLIEIHLLALKKAGFDEVIINIAYQPEQFINILGDGSRYGVRIHYSHEKNGPLGTGGGIFQALPFMEGKPFMIISADIWTDFPLESLRERNFSDAHLVMVENPDYYREGDFGLTQDGAVTLSAPKLTYANIALLHPRLFAEQTAGIFPLAPLFRAAIEKKRVTGQVFSGRWHNVGTPEQLKSLGNI